MLVVGCFGVVLGLPVLAFVAVSNPSAADTEQYAVYSAYIEDGLTGESHSLGKRRGTVLIASEATFFGGSNPIRRLRD